MYFDDLLIVHDRNNAALQVTQSSDYLPFGLSFNEYYQSRTGSITNSSYSQNKFQFQGQERQTGFDLGWYHFKYRMHDPAIGRFGMVDPLADKYTYNSTYAFSGNRLIDGVELEGKEWTKKGKYFDVTTGLNRDHLNINYFVVNNTNNFSDQDLITILNRTRASVENRFSNPIKNDGSQFYDLRTFLRQDFVPPKISISYEMIDKANVQDALKKRIFIDF